MEVNTFTSKVSSRTYEWMATHPHPFLINERMEKDLFVWPLINEWWA